MDASEPIIGIDLGTTNSVVATVHQGQPKVIASRTGQALTPSVVAMGPGGKRLVGHVAKRQAITNPQETVFATKRLIGRKFSSQQVQEAMKILPYRVVAGEHDDVRVQMGGRDWALPELSAMVLRELKLDAEAFFGRPVTKAVITVPAYFNDGQRQATRDAGRIAGLEVVRIINEPTAAALAYGFGKTVRGKIAVFDLGGGTLDVSVLQVGEDVFEVVATGGDTYLGGEDFDNQVINWLGAMFREQHSMDVFQDRMALQRMKDAAEKAKIELSTAKTVPIRLPFLFTPQGAKEALHLEVELSREKLEHLTGQLCLKALAVAGDVLDTAKVRVEDLKEVVLVGGMTRMPRIQEAVKQFFKREPSKGVHPDEVVALGAAIHGHSLMSQAQKGQVLLLDVTPQSLGVVIAGGYVQKLIPRNTAVPTSTKQIFTTSRDNQPTVKILVLQGESDVAHKNELLGEFVLGGLRQARRGEVQIEVTFDINAEGLVSVAARDIETNQKASISLTASGGLTEEELKKILDSEQRYLLESKATPELVKAKKAALQEKILEVRALLPEIQKIELAAELVRHTEKHLSHAVSAMQTEELRKVLDATEELSAALELLKGAKQRLGAW